jgi:UDP-GlcNAc:undecaprenyl-phosphate GlcNAc-1-phosphate transferase
MMDGIDGLAGGLCLMALGILGALALAGGRVADGYMLFVIVSAAGAFLCLNLRLPWSKQAAVFMGDAGSMFLGFTLAWFFVSLSQGEHRVITPVTALWLFAIPLFDTVSLMIRRILKGRSPFSADREHFHHVLQLAGYSVNQSVLIIYGLALALACTGLAGFYARAPEWIMFYGFITIFALYFWGVMHAWKVMKFARASRSAHALLPNQEKAGYLKLRTED